MPYVWGRSFSRLYEELGLLPGNLAPRQHEHLVHLACFMPFDKVAEMMEEMVSVQADEETVHRLTEQAGSWMETAQIAEVGAGGEPEPENAQPLERCVFSADGAMISLVHKQWVETRTVAIGEPQEKLNSEGEKEIHVGKLSYFSRLADASTFTKLADGELRRRKVAEAKEACAVMDGADWCQLFTERHRPDAVRILDFPHAGEHVTKLFSATRLLTHFIVKIYRGNISSGNSCKFFKDVCVCVYALGDTATGIGGFCPGYACTVVA